MPGELHIDMTPAGQANVTITAGWDDDYVVGYDDDDNDDENDNDYDDNDDEDDDWKA